MLAVVALSPNSWNMIKDYIPRIAAELESAQPGTVTRVDYGKFTRTKRTWRHGQPGKETGVEIV